jgi:Ca-activated chloride channel family protein
VQWPAGAEPVPAVLPDLYAGQPVLQAVALEAPLGAELRLTGERAGEPWTTAVAVPDTVAPAPGVGTLWARGRVQSLLDTLEIGAERDAVRAAVLPLALAHQLLTPFTSFIAVEALRQRPSDAPARERSVPNTRPRGQAPQTFAFPRTATTAAARAWLGLLALFVAIIVFALREEGTQR